MPINTRRLQLEESAWAVTHTLANSFPAAGICLNGTPRFSISGDEMVWDHQQMMYR